MEKYFNVYEIAEQLNLHPQTVRQYAKDGRRDITLDVIYLSGKMYATQQAIDEFKKKYEERKAKREERKKYKADTAEAVERIKEQKKICFEKLEELEKNGADEKLINLFEKALKTLTYAERALKKE